MSSSTKAASSRSFGFLLAAVFLAIGLWKYWNGTDTYLIWGMIGVVFLAVALSVPRLLRPIKGLWLMIGHFLGRILSPVALTLVYIISIVPVGLLLRIFRKDTLRLARDANCRTYWVSRQPPGPPPDSLKHQF